MAYALGFDKEVTRIIYSMRDWTLESVKQNGGTPSCCALKPFEIENQASIRFDPFTATYGIRVRKTDVSPHVSVLALENNSWSKKESWIWKECFRFSLCNNKIDAAHGQKVHVLPCPFDNDEHDDGIINRWFIIDSLEEFEWSIFVDNDPHIEPPSPAGSPGVIELESDPFAEFA